MLRNAVGGGVSAFTEKSVNTKMYGSTLLALRGGGSVGVKFPGKSVPVRNILMAP